MTLRSYCRLLLIYLADQMMLDKWDHVCLLWDLPKLSGATVPACLLSGWFKWILWCGKTPEQRIRRKKRGICLLKDDLWHAHNSFLIHRIVSFYLPLAVTLSLSPLTSTVLGGRDNIGSRHLRWSAEKRLVGLHVWTWGIYSSSELNSLTVTAGISAAHWSICV